VSPAPEQSGTQLLVEHSRSLMLEAYGPPAVLVDAGFAPLHFFGASRRYFSLPVGSADFSVFSLCLPELRGELKALCYRMRQDKAEVPCTGGGVLVQLGGQKPCACVRCCGAWPGRSDAGEAAVLISFERVRCTRRCSEAAGGEGGRSAAGRCHGRDRPPAPGAGRHPRPPADGDRRAGGLQRGTAVPERGNPVFQRRAAVFQRRAAGFQRGAHHLNDELRVKSLEYVQLNATLGNIQNSIRTSLVVVDRDGRVTRFNVLASRIFGLLPNDIGQFLYGVPCHLDLPQLREWVGTVVSSGDSRVEHVHQRGFHYLMQIDPYRNELGDKAGAVLTFTDISDLHRAEAAQADSEARFRQVWNSSVEGLVVVDPEGRMALVNPALERMFGYAPGELLGASVDLLVPDALRGAHGAHRERYRNAPGQANALMSRRNLRGRCKSGDEIAIEISLSSLELDGAEHVLATVSDVTERSLSEALLRASERRLRLALDAARAGSWEWFLESNNNYWSDELWDLYGIPAQSCTPSYEAWWQHHPPR
jgi:two-component system CheB/CheR fusion protein